MSVMCINCCSFDLSAAGRNAQVGLGECASRKKRATDPLFSAHYRRQCERYARAESAAITERIEWLAENGYREPAHG